MSATVARSPRPSECDNPYELSGHQMVGLAVRSPRLSAHTLAYNTSQFITEAAYLSITADTFIFLLIFYNLRRHNWRIRSIFQSPLDIYIVSLILSDLFQGVGSAMIVRWIQIGHVYCGRYCTAQGTFQTLGETSSAMGTLVIAIHTFWVIAFRKPPISKRLWVPLMIVSFIWMYVIIFIIIVATKTSNWNEPDPYWCWIGHEHLAAQLAGEYLWLWIAGLASIVLYVPLFFIVSRGYVGFNRRSAQASRESIQAPRDSDIGAGVTLRESDDIHNLDLAEKLKRERDRRLEHATVQHTDIPIVTIRRDGASHTTMPTMPNSVESPYSSPHYRPSTLSPPSEVYPEMEVDNGSLRTAQTDINAPSVSVAPPTPRRKSDVDHDGSTIDEEYESETNVPPLPTSYGLRILLYPIAYTALVLPLSIARWTSGFSTSSTTHPTSSRTTFVAGTIYYLTGFVNACLVLFVRRSVSLLSPPSKDDDDEEENGIGFFGRGGVDRVRTPIPNHSMDEKRDFGAEVVHSTARPRSGNSHAARKPRRGSVTSAAGESATATAVQPYQQTYPTSSPRQVLDDLLPHHAQMYSSHSHPIPQLPSQSPSQTQTQTQGNRDRVKRKKPKSSSTVGSNGSRRDREDEDEIDRRRVVEVRPELGLLPD